MKQLFLTAVLLSSIFISAQNSLEDYVKEGIKYHDNGEYDNALQST